MRNSESYGHLVPPYATASEKRERDAYLDSAAAERAKILALLREPSDELLAIVETGRCLATCDDSQCRKGQCHMIPAAGLDGIDKLEGIAGLRALADEIEKLP